MPVPHSVSSVWQWSVPEFQTLCFVYCESVTIKAFNPFNILSLSELKLFWDCWWKMRGRSCFNKWSALIAGAQTFPDPELAIWKACRRRLFWQSSWICRGDRRVLTALWLYFSVSLIGWPRGKALMHWSNSMGYILIPFLVCLPWWPSCIVALFLRERADLIPGLGVQHPRACAPPAGEGGPPQ